MLFGLKERLSGLLCCVGFFFDFLYTLVYTIPTKPFEKK